MHPDEAAWTWTLVAIMARGAGAPCSRCEAESRRYALPWERPVWD